MAIIDITEYDGSFYRNRLESFLPDTIIDIHTHVWERPDGQRKLVDPAELPANAWPALVADQNPLPDLRETYELMFPGKTVQPMVFGMPEQLSESPEDQRRLERMNEYVETEARKHDFPSLLLTHPSWSGEELESRVLNGGHLGAKVYLDMAPLYLPRNELRIYDYLTEAHLDVLNDHEWIVMLHIPRPDRLKDRVNLSQMLEIERRWPHVRVIIAHVGRAYCNEDVGSAFTVLKDTDRMLFDISANTNQWVFEQLISAVGPSRILFGSDLPIVRMRNRRICEDGSYINLVPAGLYDGIGLYGHMREVHGPEADEITFFLYEEIDAFQKAAESKGLKDRDIEAVFHGNAAQMLNDAGHSAPKAH